MIDLHSIFPRTSMNNKKRKYNKPELTPMEINTMNINDLNHVFEHGSINEKQLASEAILKYRQWNNIMTNG